MSNKLPSAMASFNLNNIPEASAPAEASGDWLTFDQISHAILDSAVKDIYRAQLRELWGLVYDTAERSVEQFVLMKEFEAITGDFGDAVAEARMRRVEKEKERMKEKERSEEVMNRDNDGEGAREAVMRPWKGGESAQKWRQFRSVMARFDLGSGGTEALRYYADMDPFQDTNAAPSSNSNPGNFSRATAMANTSPQPAQRSPQDSLDFVSSMRASQSRPQPQLQPQSQPTPSQHPQAYAMGGPAVALKYSAQNPGLNQAPIPTSMVQSPSSFHFPSPKSTQACSPSTTTASPGSINPQTPKQPPKLDYLNEKIIKQSNVSNVMKDQYTQWLQEIQAHYFGGDFGDFEKCLAGLQAWKNLSAYFYRSHKITAGRWNDAWWIEENYARMAFDDVLKYGGVDSVAGELPNLEEYDEAFGGDCVDSDTQELPSLEECRRLLDWLKQ